MKNDDGITWGALWHAFYAKKDDIIKVNIKWNLMVGFRKIHKLILLYLI
jgi:hypothetical protein